MEYQSRNSVIEAYRSELIRKVRQQTADVVNSTYPDWRTIKIDNSNKLIDKALEVIKFVDFQMQKQAEMIDQINEATTLLELKAIEKALFGSN